MEQVKIISEKENKLLGFKEIDAVVNFSKTPSSQEITKMFSEKYKSNEENCKVKRIKGNFGRGAFSITVRIYSSKESLERVEKKNKKPKKGIAGGAKK